MKDQFKGALQFIHHEAAGAVLLVAAALLALILANSPLSPLYGTLLDTPVSVRIGALALDKPLLLWINDGLMAIFFFLVGLEIKREMITGELSTARQAALPLIAALGGVVVPALIYWWINGHDPGAMRGWAIPTATDIAFAVGVLALLGSRIPPALKIFLLALAIIDDLGAIVIIALFYTSDLSATALLLAAIGLAVLATLNLRGVMRIAPYVLAGIFVWICVLKSGVHATLAGVATAFAVPLVKRCWQARAALTSRSLAGGVASVGGVRRAAAVRVRQCRRFARGDDARHADGSDSAGNCRGPRAWQAHWYLRICRGGHRTWNCRAPCRIVVGATFWRVDPGRHRLHHEPVHRNARLP